MRKSPYAQALPIKQGLLSSSEVPAQLFIELEYAESRSDAVGYQRADNRSDDRNPGISPVGAAFAGNGQNGVSQTRTEVSGRIDGIPRRTAEAEADSPDQDADDVRAYAGRNRADLIQMTNTRKNVPMISHRMLAG